MNDLQFPRRRQPGAPPRARTCRPSGAAPGLAGPGARWASSAAVWAVATFRYSAAPSRYRSSARSRALAAAWAAREWLPICKASWRLVTIVLDFLEGRQRRLPIGRAGLLVLGPSQAQPGLARAAVEDRQAQRQRTQRPVSVRTGQKIAVRGLVAAGRAQGVAGKKAARATPIWALAAATRCCAATMSGRRCSRVEGRVALDVVDVVDRRRQGPLVGRDHPAGHVVRRQAAIGPGHRDHRHPDFRKDVDRRPKRREHPQDDNQDRHDDEGERPRQGGFDRWRSLRRSAGGLVAAAEASD